MKHHLGVIDTKCPAPASGVSPRKMVLVVGDARSMQTDIGTRIIGNGFAYADIQQIGAELIDTLAPDIVISALFTPSFDCIDLAQILEALGYSGSYCAVSSPLPAPELIRREIRNFCPRLRFELIILVPDDEPPVSPTGA